MIALVASAGGHLAQIEKIMDERVRETSKYILITEKNPKALKIKNAYLFPYLKLNPFKFLLTIFKLYFLFRRLKVRLVITTGADLGTAAMVAGKILGIRTVFIETVIRVKTPTLTGKIAYPFSDIFLVQHKELKKSAGKRARYEGGIL